MCIYCIRRRRKERKKKTEINEAMYQVHYKRNIMTVQHTMSQQQQQQQQKDRNAAVYQLQ